MGNTIVWSSGDGIWQISGDGGVSERIVQSAQGEQLSHPQLLPGREWLLFTSQRGGRSATVARSLKSATQKVVVDGAVDARYVEATGHLVYFLPEGGLFASAFDLEHLVTTGGARSVLPAVGRADVTARRLLRDCFQRDARLRNRRGRRAARVGRPRREEGG